MWTPASPKGTLLLKEGIGSARVSPEAVSINEIALMIRTRPRSQRLNTRRAMDDNRRVKNEDDT